MKVIERILLIAIFILPALNLWGQDREICGVVVSADDKSKGLESVNVMLMDEALATSYGFRITDSNGEFCFETPKSAQGKELVLYITGFNIQEVMVPIGSNDSKPLRVVVQSKNLVIREITVKAESEARRGDTLSYIASSYKSISDKNLGDLMRKIPGLEVAQSGVVRYQGEEISKFYIEDMDLLGGGYNIAVNNVDVENIASIEVYEQHQPIAALRGLSDSHKAAVNIKFKESAKGIFNGNALLGAGIDSDGALWKGGLTGLYFSDKVQSIATYKTNNMGEDVTAELTTLHSGTATSSPLLNVAMPTTPPVSQERYLDNISHAATINSMVRIGKNTDLTAKVSHLSDERLFESEQRYIYFMPSGERLVVDEQTSATNSTTHTNATISLRSNGERFYINNSTDFGIKSEEVEGFAEENNNDIGQWLDKPALRIANNLHVVGTVGKLTLSASSVVNYNQSDESLMVTQLLDNQPTPSTEQSIVTNSLTSHNTLSTGVQMSRLNLNVLCELNTSHNTLSSQLNNHSSEESFAPEESRNEIEYNLAEVKIHPSIHYASGNNFLATLGMPVCLVNIDNHDLLRNTNKEINTINASPSLFVQYRPLRNLKITAQASHAENYGSLYDSYAGYIMYNYRTIGSMGGETPHRSTDNYNVALLYDDILSVVFATLRGGYMRTKSNIIYNTLYEGTMMTTEGVLFDNATEQWYATATLSKRIKEWRTTINASLSISQTMSDAMFENVLMANRSYQISAGVNITSTPASWLEVYYSGGWGNHNSILGTMQYSPINTLGQQVEMTVILSNPSNNQGTTNHQSNTTCFVAAQHLYNSALAESVRNLVFVDAGIGWKNKMLEVLLRAQNILGNNQYSTSNIDNNLDYTYTYQLRPSALIGEIIVKF